MAGASKSLFVTAPLVSVKTTGGSLKQMYLGDVITEDVEKESVDLLKSLGYVADSSPLDATEK